MILFCESVSEILQWEKVVPRMMTTGITSAKMTSTRLFDVYIEMKKMHITKIMGKE